MVELKKLESDVSRSESILDPILDQAKKANKNLNEISNEKLLALKIGDRVELMVAINYPMRGKWVCQEIKNNVLNQL